MHANNISAAHQQQRRNELCTLFDHQKDAVVTIISSTISNSALTSFPNPKVRVGFCPFICSQPNKKKNTSGHFSCK
jgi:hypothetical protein